MFQYIHLICIYLKIYQSMLWYFWLIIWIRTFNDKSSGINREESNFRWRASYYILIKNFLWNNIHRWIAKNTIINMHYKSNYGKLFAMLTCYSESITIVKYCLKHDSRPTETQALSRFHIILTFFLDSFVFSTN